MTTPQQTPSCTGDQLEKITQQFEADFGCVVSLLKDDMTETASEKVARLTAMSDAFKFLADCQRAVQK